MADHEAPRVPGEINDDIRQQKIAELNEVREKLSTIMAEDFKDFQQPQLVGSGHLVMTADRVDRAATRLPLQQREDLLMKEIREQTAHPVPNL